MIDLVVEMNGSSEVLPNVVRQFSVVAALRGMSVGNTGHRRGLERVPDLEDGDSNDNYTR